MAADDFESAFEEALAAEPQESASDNSTNRNATIYQGEDDFDATNVDDTTGDTDTLGGLAETDATATDDTPSGPSTADATFDWSEHKDKLVTVKVDGEEFSVPLAEAMASYMRQADYTKKTQALAEERRMAQWAREMRTAIETDPAGTVRALQQALGLESEQVEPDIFADIDPELQPVIAQMQAQQRQIDEFQQMMERQREAQVFNEVRAEVDSVRAKYPDFDAARVLPLAAERGLTILEAYKLVKADDFLTQEERQAQAQAVAAAKAAAAAEKRAAAEKVARGGSAAGTAKEQISGDTFEEMLLHRLQLASNS